MATTPERFRQSLAKGPLPPVVLIAGAEHLVVIETVDGERSYWALAHPAGQPDFHHRDSFTLALETRKDACLS